MSFHAEVLSTAQKKVLRQLAPLMTERNFYLGGGTAIAIHLGHRRSIDLDWFSGKQIPDPLRLAQEIRDQRVAFVTGQIDRGTLYGTISGVRVSLIEYRYPLLKPLVSWPQFGCVLASLDDLACMKLSALAQRGSKKDFVDLHTLCLTHRPLERMLHMYQRKYSVEDIAHLLYALVYFDDADTERMPRMLARGDWRTVKQGIRKRVREAAGLAAAGRR